MSHVAAKRLLIVLSFVFHAQMASAFEYKSDACTLVVNSRGAWAGRGGASIPLMPLFKQGLATMPNGRGYRLLPKMANLISLVGDIASFRVSQSAIAVDAGKSAVARPIGYVYIHVVDICSPRAPKTPVSLLDIYTDAEIRQSLINAPDQDLRANFHRFDQSYRLEAFEMSGLAGDGYFLYQFAFGKMDENDVEVLIQLQSPGFGGGLDMGQFYSLHFEVPGNLRRQLQAAQNRSHGFMASKSNSTDRPSFTFK